ncbi:MAG: SWIM zinc finger family protein [Candidatus Micrarchaeota archaeon]
MVKNALPRLTEASVRKLSDAQSFERGNKYFLENRVFEPVLLGKELRTTCQGSAREPYNVSVILNKNRVAKASCDCPRGGFCKHIVALLLSLARKPQSIRVLPPFASMLAEFTKDELIALVGEMVKQEPHLIDIAEFSASSRQGMVDVNTFHRLALRALQQGSSRAIEAGLQNLCGMADDLVESDGWLAAGTIYAMLLTEATRRYGSTLLEMDEEGELACAVDEIAEGLVKCLAKGSPDKQTRREWLGILLDSVLADVDLGGLDLVPSAEDAILSCATAEEWTQIEGRVREKIGKSDGYKKEALEDFLARRKKERKLPKALNT